MLSQMRLPYGLKCFQKFCSVDSVRSKTTGYEKMRVSVCVAARGDGIKLKAMIVFKAPVRET